LHSNRNAATIDNVQDGKKQSKSVGDTGGQFLVGKGGHKSQGDDGKVGEFYNRVYCQHGGGFECLAIGQCKKSALS
jgi:hypothetical protein